MMFHEVDMRIWLEKAQGETKGECWHSPRRG